MNEELMNNTELKMLMETLNEQTQRLAINMNQHPTDRKVIDELVISYNMYLSCIELANKRNIKVGDSHLKTLKVIQEELIKHDILTEEEYVQKGSLDGKHL